MGSLDVCLPKALGTLRIRLDARMLAWCSGPRPKLALNRKTLNPKL